MEGEAGRGGEDDTVIQVSLGTVDQDFGGGGKESASGPMLKEEPTGFSRGLDLGWKRGVKGSTKFSGLNSQKDSVALQEHGKRSRDLSGGEGRARSSLLHTSRLRGLLKSMWPLERARGMWARAFYDRYWMEGKEGGGSRRKPQRTVFQSKTTCVPAAAWAHTRWRAAH